MTRRKQWGVRVLYIKHGAAANYWQVWFSSHFFNFLSPLIQCNFLIEPLTIAQIQFSLFQVLRRHPYLLTQINIAVRGGQVDAFFININESYQKIPSSSSELIFNQRAVIKTVFQWKPPQGTFLLNNGFWHNPENVHSVPGCLFNLGWLSTTRSGRTGTTGGSVSTIARFFVKGADHWSCYFCEGI